MKVKGFKNIQFPEKKGVEEANLLDGLKLLLEDRKCNLGWRVVARSLLDERDFQTLLKKTHGDTTKRFSKLIGATQKGEVNQMLRVLRKLRDGKQTDNEELADLLKKIGIDAHKMARDFMKEEVGAGEPPGSNPGVRKTSITATTIQSSKGLAADYVFITHFDDRYFIKETDKTNVSDQDICNFLVALTRARRRVFLISSDTARAPLFLKWIDKRRIREIIQTSRNPASGRVDTVALNRSPRAMKGS
jgi:superfamily I DNA/RNA helicase